MYNRNATGLTWTTNTSHIMNFIISLTLGSGESSRISLLLLLKFLIQNTVGDRKKFLDYLEILIGNLLGYDDEDGCDESDLDNEENNNLAEDDFDFDDKDFDVGCFDARRRDDDEMPAFIYRRYGGWINDEGWAIRHDGA